MTSVAEASNADRVQTLLSAFGAGDQDTVLGLMDPAVELVPLAVRAGLVSEPYRGFDGVRAYLEDPLAAHVERSFVVTRLRTTRDTVVVFGHLPLEGAGAPTPALWVWRLREGFVASVMRFEVPPAERFVFQAGDGDAVIRLYDATELSLETALRAAVERTTGRRVLAFQSSMNPEHGIIFEAFVLTPDLR